MPPVPEEDDMFRNSTLNANYPDLDLMTPMNQINELSQESAVKNEQASHQPALAQNEQEVLYRIFNTPLKYILNLNRSQRMRSGIICEY